jgi:hypothetical protein
MTYRIKPLVWQQPYGPTISVWMTQTTPLGVGIVEHDKYDKFVWRWSNYGTPDTKRAAKCLSIDDGKAQAEKWYRERLMQALEEA